MPWEMTRPTAVETVPGFEPSVLDLAGRADETGWLSELRNGQAFALEELSRHYRSRIVRLAMRYVRNASDAEDLAQDVLLSVWRHIGRLQGEIRLWPWMSRITINAALSHLRARRRRPDTTAGECGDGSGPDTELRDRVMDAEDRARLGQFRHHATLALRALPPVYRRAVVLMDVRQYSAREASRSLGIPVPTVKSRAIRGRRLLRRALAAYEGGFGLRDRSS